MVFSRDEGYVDRPVKIACGQCQGCRLERSRQWAVRCMHEASQHEKNCFITLTYDQEHLPPGNTLDVSHWQKFVKRARKKMGSFRYYHCGEYGELLGRPHYHACLFGIDFKEDRYPCGWSRENTLYRSEELEELWTFGFSIIGEMTFRSAAYVARYVMKKVTGRDSEKEYGERKHPYTTMSRRPGLGKTWIDLYGKEVYRYDEVIVNGKKTRPPKYYDGQYEVTNAEQFGQVQVERVRKAALHKADQTPERLVEREKVQIAKTKHFSREIG